MHAYKYGCTHADTHVHSYTSVHVQTHMHTNDTKSNFFTHTHILNWTTLETVH